MNIEETVERFIADFERNRGYRANYFWRDVYDRALTHTEASSIAVAETVLYGRREQLRECMVDDPEAKVELEGLRVAIERLRSVS